MKVYFIGAGPGDPELLTLKAKRLLESCPVCIYAGSLVSDHVMNTVPKGTELHNSAEMSLDDIVEVVKSAKENEQDVARLHTGDPSIYGAIREQIFKFDEMGVEYETVPGVSSFQGAAAALNLELTAPEISQTIILTRAAGRTPTPEKQSIDALAKSQSTMCIFLSVTKIREMAVTLAEDYGADCPIAVVYRATWPDQQIFRGTLEDIADQVEAAGIRKTAMIIVGHALGDESTFSMLYDKNFSHEYRHSAAK